MKLNCAFRHRYLMSLKPFLLPILPVILAIFVSLPSFGQGERSELGMGPEGAYTESRINSEPPDSESKVISKPNVSVLCDSAAQTKVVKPAQKAIEGSKPLMEPTLKAVDSVKGAADK